MYYSFRCQVQSMELELYEVALDYLIFFDKTFATFSEKWNEIDYEVSREAKSEIESVRTKIIHKRFWNISH